MPHHIVPYASIKSSNTARINIFLHLLPPTSQRGSFLDSNRNIRSWMSREARGMLYNKTTCTGSWGDAIMHIAAAEVAYEAYREHRGPAEGNYTMPGHAVFTPDMLFFVSLCRSLCGLQDACATVLGNMTAFSRAFSCPPGSTVNMRNKCSFFRT